jgi:hypothetical protein
MIDMDLAIIKLFDSTLQPCTPLTHSPAQSRRLDVIPLDLTWSRHIELVFRCRPLVSSTPGVLFSSYSISGRSEDNAGSLHSSLGPPVPPLAAALPPNYPLGTFSNHVHPARHEQRQSARPSQATRRQG